MAVQERDVTDRNYHKWTREEERRVTEECLRRAASAASITEIARDLSTQLNDTTTGILRRIAKLRRSNPRLDQALAKFSRAPESGPAPKRMLAEASPAMAARPINRRVVQFLTAQAETLFGPFTADDVNRLQALLERYGEAEAACGLISVMQRHKDILFAAWEGELEA